MKVLEKIIEEGLINGSGISFSTVYSRRMIEVDESDLNAKAIDWSWVDAENDLVGVDDTHLIVRWYPENGEDGKPLAEWDIWTSELKEG